MRVAVLGGGYAGLMVTRKLEERLPPDDELVLVDETGDHLVQHELHRTIRYPGFADDITVPLDALVTRATVREATVADLDPDAGTVALADGGSIEYDAGVVALGSQTADYDIPGVAAHATPLKRLEHAATLRRDFFDAVDPNAGTVAVVGAGLSGIQTAGEFAELADREGVAADVDVVLLERAETVAPSFPEHFRTAARDALRDLGVRLETGTEVTEVTASTVVADDRDVPYDVLAWTGGVRGPDALGGERRAVRADLRLSERTFIAGDAADVVDADGERVPASAQAAVRSAPVVARNVERVLDAARTGDSVRHLEKWAFETPGWLISVGDDAVAQLGPEVFRGTAANVIKTSVGLTYLAEHGSLRDAVAVVRDELGDDRVLPDREDRGF
ncbi:NAD(P)/FAD-dependent oxidoreductase [Halarchaeum nitratireducens]|uniref:NADH dehydrogenase n=1 Tax=Halarchaeum nitratireducens TaxID=489913 RepID=A0A830GC36_9EURY|nr:MULTISPECIES: FAD-dependent oxidoreductase [Halarchaeum]MBP2252180.1 NADH dehydrogenase [Halarchaeum solikamskense]GGN18475.1 NADH dehydrogenase [Halarchaeum nitratireducens]